MNPRHFSGPHRTYAEALGRAVMAWAFLVDRVSRVPLVTRDAWQTLAEDPLGFATSAARVSTRPTLVACAASGALRLRRAQAAYGPVGGFVLSDGDGRLDVRWLEWYAGVCDDAAASIDAGLVAVSDM